MKLVPYLTFDGNCEAAFLFYEQIFGGKVEDKMTWGDSPMETQVSAEWHEKVMHMSIQIGDWMIMGSDNPPNYFKKPQGMSVSVQVDGAQKAEQIFSALAKNGSVQMDIEKTFWAERFGMVTDQFGIPWMINCDKATE